MDFILSTVEVSSPKSRRPRKGEDSFQRGNAKKYFIFKDQNKIRVCQQFFMRTLSINNGPINTAFERTNSLGSFEAEDNRGNHTPKNKTKDVDVGIVKNHIER
ncbi:hypothetical protein HHI36_019159 [Cryptolaemus montrouzieri]|uniref:Uncharacterized protein n=1 Tax=Cryptolaemus montrouzieri TaxID=559131 RepID=A0ABD2P2M2_9CUCU